MSGALPARLSVITLGARDLPRLREFYRGLGFVSTVEADDGFTAFLTGGVVFSLYPIESLARLSGTEVPPEGIWSGTTLAINVDNRGDVDGAFAAALAAGATSAAAPADMDFGGRSAVFADPEGNRWEIAWVSGIEFDARGAVTRFGG
jgi:catechol 2,3-dioxygenase-like lactoylglutathione lyase family enzyme